MKNRLCWSCKHFYFDGGDSGYSEYTPGYMGSMTCHKKKFDYRLEDMTQDTLRVTLMTAEECDKFEKRENR